MRLKRKRVQVTDAERQRYVEHAAELGVSEAALGREWVNDFIENGTDAEKPDHTTIQLLLSDEQLETALARCVDDGVSLQLVFKQRIARLGEK